VHFVALVPSAIPLEKVDVAIVRSPDISPILANRSAFYAQVVNMAPSWGLMTVLTAILDHSKSIMDPVDAICVLKVNFKCLQVKPAVMIVLLGPKHQQMV
jgi:hypothetical protein